MCYIYMCYIFPDVYLYIFLLRSLASLLRITVLRLGVGNLLSYSNTSNTKLWLCQGFMLRLL